MKIQELERKTGLERPSIRFYEKEGLLIPKRLENGYREYTDEDAELLKKIKLLRRLGMSIEKIRALQQGSADLSAVIAQQVSYHSSQIDEHRRCRAVCEAIRDDGAEFSSLDAEHYLRLLQEIRIDDKTLGRTNFQENVQKEIHPWKRYFARWLDYTFWGAIVNFIWIVLLRVRPILMGFWETVFGIAAMALFVPVEALLLHKFGTTPGKYIMGIRLEYIQGGNLPYSEALYRSLHVFTGGVCLGIPLINIIFYIFRYCQLTGRSWRIFARHDQVEGPQDMPWDEDTEIIYDLFDWKRGVAAAVCAAALIALTIVGVIDGFKPKHRGSELTIAQVAENYNATMVVLQQEVDYYDKLQKDGTKKPVSPNRVIIDMNHSVGNHQMQFAYEVEKGIVRSIQIHHSWDSVFWLQPLSGDALMMSSSLLLAQEGCSLPELQEFMRVYESHLDDKTASFAYENILIEWNIDSQKSMHQGSIYADGDENVTAALDFRITIR